MIINLQSLSSLFTSYSAAFKTGFASAEPIWQNIASEVPSGSASNLYSWLGQFPKLREWVGERIVKNMAAHAYTVVNKKFESTVGVARENLEDDTYGQFSTIFQEMGYSSKLHPDELIFDLVLHGHTELCYDGQGFFDTDHPVIVNGAATTEVNYDAVGGGAMWVLMDTRRPLKPFIYQKRASYEFQTFTNPADEHVFKWDEFLYGVRGRSAAAFGLWQLAYASLNTLNGTNVDLYVTHMMNLKSDEGKPLGIRPNVLMCGPSNRAAARNLVEVQYLASGATNPNYKEFEVIVSPYMV